MAGGRSPLVWHGSIHSIEFQDQACKLVSEQGYTQKKAAEELGITDLDAAGLAEEAGIAQAGGSGRAGLCRQRRSQAAQGPHPRVGEAAARAGDGEGDFKKSDGLLRQPEPVKFEWIQEHASEFEVSIMCEVLEVSRSGYYAWVKRPPSAGGAAGRIDQADPRGAPAKRRHLRQAAHRRGTGRAGHQGLREHRRQLMKQAEIRSIMHRRFVVQTTDSNHD